MKKLLLSLMMVGAGIAASAQTSPVKFGIKAGVTFPKASTSEDTEGMDIKTNTSFYIGGTADIPVGGMFSIQPGITLSGKGFKVDESEIVDGFGGSILAKSNVWYIEIPVNALVNIPVGDGKVFLGAGPYYGMAITGKVKTKVSLTMDGQTQSESSDEDIDFGKDGDLKRGDFGINFLGGYQLSNGFNIHAGYGLGLSNIVQDSEGDLKNRVLSVGLGFSF